MTLKDLYLCIGGHLAMEPADGDIEIVTYDEYGCYTPVTYELFLPTRCYCKLECNDKVILFGQHD